MVLRRARADAPEATQAAAIERGLDLDAGRCRTATAAGPASIAATTRQWLTQVPFADHNAMIDPSTADITGRVLECLPTSRLRRAPSGRSRARSSSCAATRAATAPGTAAGASTTSTAPGRCCAAWPRIGEDMSAPHVRRAVAWLLAHQNRDGGWGESIASYTDPTPGGVGRVDAQPDGVGGDGPGRGRARSAAPPSAAASATCSNARTPHGTWEEKRVDRHRLPEGLLSRTTTSTRTTSP